MAAATMDKRPLSPDIDAVSSGPAAKRSKTEPEAQTHENDEFALARLRCLGVDVDEPGDALSAIIVSSAAAELTEKTGKGKSRNLSSQEEKELRRERGELLLKLFREVPWLADSASARRAEKNQERAQMWEVITQKVNDNFGDKLEYLSVDKVKKLLTYYKKKDDGSYDNIKNSIPMDEENEGEDNNDVSTVSESRSESGDDEASAPKGVVLIEEKADQQLMEFLASMSAAVSTPSAPLKEGIKQENEAAPHTVASTESHYQLKKDRHDFVVAQAEHYMERMCFDNSSRSAAVNAERHNMWIKITHKANEKFASQLGPLGVEQAKKLYSNCKRRRRVKAEQQGGRGDDQQLTHSSRGNSATPDENNDLSSLMDDINDYDPPAATNFEELIRGLDRSVEIDDLKKQLKEREAEIVRLKKVIEDQAADYQSRTKSILEIFKVALDKKVADDIRLLAA